MDLLSPGATPHPPSLTSSLVSLEAVLARGGTGLSEAVSARASGLFSWYGEEACGWAGLSYEGHSRGRRGLGLSLAIHPRACLSLPGPRRDLHFHILPRIRGQPGSTIQGSGTIPRGTSWMAHPAPVLPDSLWS